MAMTSLTFLDIFVNAMHFNDEDGLLVQSCQRFCPIFKEKRIPFYIIGGFALIQHNVVRNTKDIDIVVHENDLESAANVSIQCNATSSNVFFQMLHCSSIRKQILQIF
jgi:hypothetical protein